MNKKSTIAIVVWSYILLILTLVLGYIYFHPTKETMTCQQNYTCVVQHEFIKIIKTKNEILLSSNSTIINKPYVIFYGIGSSRHRASSHVFHILIDGKQPFIMYNDNREEFENYSTYFSEYIKHPDNGFVINSSANIYWIMSPIIILFFFYIANLIKKKRHKVNY